jgi:glycosyltransferase involved in cell wall biosynthesis
LNYLNNDELAAIYSGAEIFIFPSLYEGFGYPPLEAMACGCPVVSSNVSSMPEILGDACVYFDPYDVNDMYIKIKDLIDDKLKREKFVVKGFEQVKKYMNDTGSNKILELFRGI